METLRRTSQGALSSSLHSRDDPGPGDPQAVLSVPPTRAAFLPTGLEQRTRDPRVLP